MKKQLMRCGIGTVFVLVMVFSLWGCGGPQVVPAEPDKSEPPVQEESSAFAEMLNTLDGSRFTYMEGTGNISAEDFVSALKKAAADGYTLEEGVEDGYDPTAGYCWSLEAYFEGDPETTGISWNDLHIRAECYFTENLVKIWYGKAGAYDVATFNDESLYQLILHKGDQDPMIDEEAFQKYENILTEKMEETFLMMKSYPGNFFDYELCSFCEILEYKEADGCIVKLYDFDFALLIDTPQNIVLAGGMYLDGNIRLRGLNVGQFAVRLKDNDPQCYVFMLNDEKYDPLYADNGDETFWHEKISDRLTLEGRKLK